MKRQKIHKLIQEKSIILDYIQEEKCEYDLTDYDSEYDVYYEIPFVEYPKQLQEFLSSAWDEIEKIDKQIRLIKAEYNQPILSSSHGWTDDDWTDLHNS